MPVTGSHASMVHGLPSSRVGGVPGRHVPSHRTSRRRCMRCHQGTACRPQRACGGRLSRGRNCRPCTGYRRRWSRSASHACPRAVALLVAIAGIAVGAARALRCRDVANAGKRIAGVGGAWISVVQDKRRASHADPCPIADLAAVTHVAVRAARSRSDRRVRDGRLRIATGERAVARIDRARVWSSAPAQTVLHSARSAILGRAPRDERLTRAIAGHVPFITVQSMTALHCSVQSPVVIDAWQCASQLA